MNKNIFITVLFLLNVILIGFIYILKQNNNKTESVLSNIIQYKYWKELESTGLKLTNHNIKDRDSVINLKEIIGKTPKLIFKFSETDCSECVKSEVINLDILSKEVGSENIIILTGFSNPKNFLLFRTKSETNIRAYNMENQILGLPIETENYPFLFIVDSSLNVNSIFVPFKEAPVLSEKYYNIVKKNFKL